MSRGRRLSPRIRTAFILRHYGMDFGPINWPYGVVGDAHPLQMPVRTRSRMAANLTRGQL